MPTGLLLRAEVIERRGAVIGYDRNDGGFGSVSPFVPNCRVRQLILR